MSRREPGNIRELFRKKSQRDWNRIRNNLVRRSRKQRHADGRPGTAVGTEDITPGNGQHINDGYVDAGIHVSHPITITLCINIDSVLMTKKSFLSLSVTVDVNVVVLP